MQYLKQFYFNTFIRIIDDMTSIFANLNPKQVNILYNALPMSRKSYGHRRPKIEKIMQIVKLANDKWTWNRGLSVEICLIRLVPPSSRAAASCTWPDRRELLHRPDLTSYAMSRRPSKHDKRKTGINNRFDFSSQVALSHVLDYLSEHSDS